MDPDGEETLSIDADVDGNNLFIYSSEGRRNLKKNVNVTLSPLRTPILFLTP